MSIALTLLLLLVASCGPKRVLVDGRDMSFEEGTRTLYEQGQRAQAAGNMVEAAARYRDLVDKYPEADQAPDALAELGQIALAEGGCVGATSHLSRLVQIYPDHPRAAGARKTLERCGASSTPVANAELGALEAKYIQAGTDAERLAAAQKAAETAASAGEHGAEVRWRLKAYRLETDPAKRSASEAEITRLIDGTISFQDVRELLEEQSDDNFPKALLIYKLGRIQYHIRDLANAKESLESYLARWPSGPYAKGAKDLLGLIAARAVTNPRTIGVLVPSSGKLKAYGESVLQAVKLALGEQDQKGGAPPINLVIRDSKGDPAEAARAVRDFVLVDGAIAVVGALFRVEAEGAAYKAQELGIPLVTLTAEESISDVGPYVFRAGLTNGAQMDALVGYVMDILGMKRFAILYPRHPYGEELLHLFWDRVEAKKGEIRGVQSYAANETTFTEPVKTLVGRDVLDLRGDYHMALKECEKQPDSYRKGRCERNVKNNVRPIIDFDALFIPDYPATLALVTPALAFEDIIVEKDPRQLYRIEKTLGHKVTPVTLLGASGWNSAKLPEKAGRYVENALFTDGFFPGKESKPTSEFVHEFNKRHQRQPSLPEALFFDATRMVRDLVVARQPATRDAMRQALREVRDFPGVTGKLSFDERGEVHRDVQILTIKDGEIKEAALPSEKAPVPGGASR